MLPSRFMMIPMIPGYDRIYSIVNYKGTSVPLSSRRIVATNDIITVLIIIAF